MESSEQILQLIKDKGITAIEVFEKCKSVFENLKSILQQQEKELKSKMSSVNPRVPVEFNDKGRLEVHFKVANDVLIFLMHTNIFTFDSHHIISKSSYIKENPLRGFCGVISVYNFLNDSIRYNRSNDTGLLIARMFVNNENHFFVEGKHKTGVLFNDFENDVIGTEKLKKFVEHLLILVLEDDVPAPPFDTMLQISLQQLNENAAQSGLVSGKRFGFVVPGSSDDA